MDVTPTNAKSRASDGFFEVEDPCMPEKSTRENRETVRQERAPAMTVASGGGVSGGHSVKVAVVIDGAEVV